MSVEEQQSRKALLSSSESTDPSKSLLQLFDSIGVIAKIPTKALQEAMRQRDRRTPDRPPFTAEELTEIVNKPEVSKECTEHLLTQCKWGFDQEEDRRRSIDSKAAALAALVSASLLLLMGKVFDIDGWNKITGVLPLKFTIVVLVVALLALLASAGLLLGAVIVRSFRGPNEENVFDVDILGDPEAYQRSLAIHFWVMQTANGTVNLRKAGLLRLAQIAYAAFLASSVFMGIAFAVATWG
jgi:hypothetical protein